MNALEACGGNQDNCIYVIPRLKGRGFSGGGKPALLGTRAIALTSFRA